MSRTIPAIFDAGVFRPLEPVVLAEGTQAKVVVSSQAMPPLTGAAEQSATWPPGYFEQTAGALAGEEFERPPQGELPQRKGW